MWQSIAEKLSHLTEVILGKVLVLVLPDKILDTHLNWNFRLQWILFLKNKFIYGCVGSLLLRAGFSLVAASGGYSSLRCAGFSLRWLLLLRSTGSRRMGFSSWGTRALECRPSSCGTRAYLLRGMWDLRGPGLELMSPALAGGFLTTAPPGKPNNEYFLSINMLPPLTVQVIFIQKKYLLFILNPNLSGVLHFYVLNLATLSQFSWGNVLL